MVVPFDLEPDEVLLEHARATFYVTRMIAQTGTLYVTDRRTLFHPTGRLEKAIGAAYPVDIAHRDVQRFACDGSGTRRVVIRTAIQTYRFVGRDIDALERRLGVLLGDSGARAPGSEEVLATARVHLYVSRMLTQSGMLYLTTRRVSFVPSGVIDRAVGARAVDLPLEDITEVAAAGSIDRRTTIQGKGQRLTFLGQLPAAFLDGLRGALAGIGIALAKVPGAARPGSCGHCGEAIDPALASCPYCGSAAVS